MNIINASYNNLGDIPRDISRYDVCSHWPAIAIFFYLPQRHDQLVVYTSRQDTGPAQTPDGTSVRKVVNSEQWTLSGGSRYSLVTTHYSVVHQSVALRSHTTYCCSSTVREDTPPTSVFRFYIHNTSVVGITKQVNPILVSHSCIYSRFN